MQAVADMAEMTRAWAAEHYIGHWDGYSVANHPTTPNNYYLHSNLAGKFSMIITGTDQTGATTRIRCLRQGRHDGRVHRRRHVQGDVRRCMRQIATNPATEIAARRVDPRHDRALARARPAARADVTTGETEARDKIASMDARPEELALWLRNPTFNDIKPQLKLVATVDGGPAVPSDWDLSASGTGGFTEPTPAAADATFHDVFPNVTYALSETVLRLHGEQLQLLHQRRPCCERQLDCARAGRLGRVHD